MYITKELDNVRIQRLDLTQIRKPVDGFVFSVDKELSTELTLVYFVHRVCTNNEKQEPILCGILKEHNHFAKTEDGYTCAEIRKIVYNYGIKCVDYSQSDFAIANKFALYHKITGTSIMEIISNKQESLLSYNLQQRHNKEIADIDSELKRLPCETNSMKKWLQYGFMKNSSYFFYNYQRRANVTGVCSVCGSTINSPYATAKALTKCSVCGSTLEYRPVRYKNSAARREVAVNIVFRKDIIWVHFYDILKTFSGLKQSLTVLQHFIVKVSKQNIRYFSKDYFKRTKKLRWCNTTLRHILSSIGFVNYYSFNQKKIENYIGMPNLGDIHIKALVRLFAAIQDNRVETLLKLGNYDLADMFVRDYIHTGKQCKNGKLHHMLGIKREYVQYVKTLKRYQLSILQSLTRSGIQVKLDLKALLDVGFKENEILLANYLGAQEIEKYVEEQSNLTRQKVEACHILLNDYLNTFVKDDFSGLSRKTKIKTLLPANIEVAHDYRTQLKRYRCDTNAFQKICKTYTDQYSFFNKDFTIVIPKSYEDLVNEGVTLHHCVASYATKVINGLSVIVFIRRNDSIDIPFYTIELRGGAVVQCKGDHNTFPTKEVEEFVKEYTEFLGGNKSNGTNI